MSAASTEPTHKLNQRMIAVGVLGIIVISVLIGTVLFQRPTDGPVSDPALIHDGQAIYATYCAGCHGINLEGQPNWRQPLANGSLPAPPHDETGHTWHHADELLFLITKEGGQAAAPPGYPSGMPAFGTQLSDEEIWAVLAYIKSTWPAEIQVIQQEITQQSE